MLIADQAMNSMSTSPESDEADCGKSGKVDSMSGGPQGPGLGGLPPPQEHDQEDEAEHGQDAAQPYDVQGGGAVAADHRIVVEAVEQDLVDQAADLAAGRLDQAQPDVACRVLEAEDVARDLAAGSRDDNAGGVRELVAVLVVDVVEADGVGEPADRRRRAGQEVPARLGARPRVARQDLAPLP